MKHNGGNNEQLNMEHLKNTAGASTKQKFSKAG